MSDSKQRLIVMNGQCIVQQQQDGVWHNDKVSKAGLLKPGIYDLHLAQVADQLKPHDGVLLHSDKTYVYQKVGKDYIKHPRQSFDKLPEVGLAVKISYSSGKAVTVASTGKLVRGISR